MKYLLIALFSIILSALIIPQSQALCVKSSSANLRKGPGTKYDKTWQVFRYMPLKRLQRKGSWYKVKDVDNDIHWVYGNLVTGKYDCAVVKADEANIRTGPGTKYRRHDLSPALKYDAFRVLQQKGSWVKVKDELGNVGWIFRKLLWMQ